VTHERTYLNQGNGMIVLSLALASQDAAAQELARTIVEGSPGLAERNAKQMADYVARTVGQDE